jgi:Zn-dependent protease with chaperone function
MMRVVLGALFLLTGSQSVNFFSLKQDVEIGSASEKEAKASLPLVGNPSINRYVTSVGQRLVQDRNLPAVHYRFQIVNSKEVNSVGFPGGAIYVYRGLLEIASNDDEIAAILAHEVSHVGSRHGTAQLSRQLLAQAPIQIAAGLDVSEVWKEQITKLGISIGLDAPFLRYSRDQELEAGLMTVRLVAGARYDPNAVRTLLEKIEEAQGVDPARTSAFVFNHPQAQSVSPEIADEIDTLSIPALRAHASNDFRAFRAGLQRVNYQPAKTPAATPVDALAGSLPNVFTHPMDFYRLAYPAGWQVTRTGPNGAIIAPTDGIQSTRGSADLTHGVMFDLFDISVADRSLTLEQATNRLIVSLRQRNELLRKVPGAEIQTLVSDEPGLRSVMIGKVDATGQPEVAWVVTRLYYQTLFYMVFVAPEDEFSTYQPIFEQMIRSVRLR